MDNPLVQLDPGLFVWTIITFLILLGVLTRFAWKPLLKALETRENEISQSLEDAEKAKQELERLSAESDEIIAKARSEAQGIVSEGKKAAEQLTATTLNKAKEEAMANLSAAKEQIKIERDKAIVEIKGEVVNLSLSIAEKLVKKNLSKEDNKSLIDESLKNVKGYEA
ncbi:MAG: ATP synthase subunit b [Candidatus Neomarinimicrobiota bacterium]|jgi:F-type H+-transporting ATPase subunit b|nr:MAG: ATP synthase subunit b [Candidatus Neomarinimicrobiota bacterium]